MVPKIVFCERFGSILSNVVVSTYANQNSNGIHAGIQ